MEWFSEKYLQKGESLLSRMTSLEATLHNIKRCEADLEMDFSQRLQVVKSEKRKQEQKLRKVTKEHERFLKNKKAKKSE